MFYISDLLGWQPWLLYGFLCLSSLDRNCMAIADVVLCAGMIKVVGIVILSAVFLGESKIFTIR